MESSISKACVATLEVASEILSILGMMGFKGTFPELKFVLHMKDLRILNLLHKIV